MDDLISRQSDYIAEVSKKGDTIYRADAIDALEREKTYSTAYRDGYVQTDIFKQYNMGLTDGIKALNKLPSAQPEIIRCKDCKHYKAYEYTGRLACHYVIGGTVVRNLDDFCSRAERREG